MNTKSNALKSPVIEESEVLRFISLKEAQSFLKKRLDALNTDLDTVEDLLIAKFESGAVNKSEHEIEVKESCRRYPKWKECFINRLGKDAADDILNSTTPTVTKTIVIK